MNKALIIDDSPANLKLARMTLESAGYAVLEAGNGFDGLKLALKHQPGIIFLDIQMPQMDGVEVLRKIKESPPLSQTPVIAVTARNMKGDREHFMSQGFDEFIPKPISIRDLISTANQFCRP